jgi:hypothetical protein
MNTIRQRLLWLQWLEAYKKYRQLLRITSKFNSPQEGSNFLLVDFLVGSHIYTNTKKYGIIKFTDIIQFSPFHVVAKNGNWLIEELFRFELWR